MSAGFTQETLADLLELDQTTVSRWTRTGKVSIEQIARLEEVFELPRGWLFVSAGLVEDELLSKSALTRADAEIGKLKSEVEALRRSVAVQPRRRSPRRGGR